MEEKRDFIPHSDRGLNEIFHHAKGILPDVPYIEIAKIRIYEGTNGEECPYPAAFLKKTPDASYSYPHRTWGDVFFKFSH